MDAPIYENKVRFVCISDTHEKLEEVLPMVPNGDVLLHAGDFTNYGDIGEVIKFNAELGYYLHTIMNMLTTTINFKYLNLMYVANIRVCV